MLTDPNPQRTQGTRRKFIAAVIFNVEIVIFGGAMFTFGPTLFHLPGSGLVFFWMLVMIVTLFYARESYL